MRRTFARVAVLSAGYPLVLLTMVGFL